ncbi:hypothetical protein EYC84_001467 [Monilinia fructicola]|uniref:Protein-lysine N-methyltransferase EFM6 n=1 Tax=Monilinia fructicola TaxID=38448 RepID=A0A5M9JS06_MONFR|nr:hypothetical protein EYC84_001467 [Monilinia fructicola]
MASRSPSPEFSPLAIGTDLAPLPTYKAATTSTVDFSGLLDPPLKLHEDLSKGCGGQLWPAGMVLAQHMLRYHKNTLSDARMGEPLPDLVKQEKPDVILAADCVYFEPAFPLLLQTLEELLELSKNAVIYFCFKKRRRADMQFMKNAKKKFLVEEIEDQDRETFTREGLFLYTFKRKS